MVDELLKGAAGVNGIWSLAAFAIAGLLTYLLRQKGKVPTIAWAVIAVVALLGLVPIVGALIVQTADSAAVYEVRVNVIDETGKPISAAEVTDSLGDAASSRVGAWQFEIPRQRRPADGKVTVFASIPSAFRHGSSELVLADDLFPSVSVTVQPDPGSTVSGIVSDAAGRPLSDAAVIVEGHDDERVVTTIDGTFTLPAHAAAGQQIMLRAEKRGFATSRQLEPAGPGVAVTLLPQ